MLKLPAWVFFALPAFTLAAATWLLLSQGWVAAQLQQQAASLLGRELTVAGGTHLEFSPGLAVRLDDVSLSNPDRMEDFFITAPSLRLDLTLWGLLSHRIGIAKITLERPLVTLAIDELQRTSWPHEPPPQPMALRFLLNDATLRFLDQRNGQSFAIDEVNAVTEISAAGELSVAGSARINGQTARIDAYVKDIARLSAEGSPADLSMAAPALSAGFSGRLSTAGILGLAGNVTLSGPDLRRAMAWTGTAPGGAVGLKDFALSGAIDARGRAVALHGITARLDRMAATGDLNWSFLGDVPRIEALLNVDAIDLDSYLPATGWSGGDWGTAELGFSALRGLEAAVTLSTRKMNYRGLQTGPARIAATLSAGKLEAQIASQVITDASVTLDGSGATPAFALSLKGNVPDAARLLAPLTGLSGLDGKGTLNLSFSASGQTQQEMIATLKGEAELALTEGAVHGIDNGNILPAEANFSSLSARLAARDGIIAVQALNLMGPAHSVTATGEIDLLRHALELRVETVASGRFVVQGPWSAPQVLPDQATPYISGAGN